MAFGLGTYLAIALLFFLHGPSCRAGPRRRCRHWRLHLGVSPDLRCSRRGCSQAAVVATDPPSLTGHALLMCVPATVQSAIAFTSLARAIARGCAARGRPACSYLPYSLLVSLLLNVHGARPRCMRSQSICIALRLLRASPDAGSCLGGLNKNAEFVVRLILLWSTAPSARRSRSICHRSPWELGVLVVSCCILRALCLMSSPLWEERWFNQEPHHILLRARKKLLPGGQWPGVFAAAPGASDLPLILFTYPVDGLRGTSQRLPKRPGVDSRK